MLIHILVMFTVALILLIVGMLIFGGNINLIHEYHRKNVKDLRGYGRAIGRCLMWLSAAHLLSGSIVLMLKSEEGVILSIAFHVVALIVFIIAFIKVQKKFNGSIIS